ncbi:DUF1338-domain-containing protein [Biscogniauxia marginata]|nr:DUF1338-domain-containing protein [Biscogniauxia marginata]
MTLTITNVSEPNIGVAAPQAIPLVHPDELRTMFALAMSQMYKGEVPLYGDLVRIVQDVNEEFLKQYSDQLPSSTGWERLALERHGAIRLGKVSELRTVRRIFALLGMHPVGYYDLSVAGLPMHATCFRPIDRDSLDRNPFRIFTTLLRPELIRSNEARDSALNLLSRRMIFSDELMRMISNAEKQGSRLSPDQAETFIQEALRTFSWAPVAASTYTEYQHLKSEHPILADIACFRTAHINHLTPRTLNIESAQRVMSEEGMAVKDRIEGPPFRECPILLRQTSFLALEEKIQFSNGDNEDDNRVIGSHRARFGEIEQRGAAVTPAGRLLYDQLLGEATTAASGLGPEAFDRALEKAFRKYPDNWSQLRRQGLVYCEYRCTKKSLPTTVIGHPTNDPTVVERLIDEGILETVPITYEDFLPFSAAGIFQSNLSGKSQPEIIKPTPDIGSMEEALECPIIDPDALYAAHQKRSLDSSLSKLASSL